MNSKRSVSSSFFNALLFGNRIQCLKMDTMHLLSPMSPETVVQCPEVSQRRFDLDAIILWLENLKSQFNL